MSLLQNTLSLGCVKEVYDYHLIVKLPNGSTGKVFIQSIGDGYTELLQSLVDGAQNLNADVASLKDIFFVGQIVRCCILGSPEANKQSQISLNPRLVNQNVPRHLLTRNICLHAVVHSVEDHGYLLDWGQLSTAQSTESHKNQLVFLREEDAHMLKAQISRLLGKDTVTRLKVGQIVPCILHQDSYNFSSGTSGRMLRVTCQPEALMDSVLTSKNTKNLHFGLLLPGMWLQVHKTLSKPGKEHSIKCSIKDIQITIHLPHFNASLEIAAQMTVCILSIDPITKSISASLLSHLLPPIEPDTVLPLLVLPTSLMLQSHVGKVLSAAVTRHDKKVFMLKLPFSNLLAVVNKQHVRDDGNWDKAKSTHPPGTQVNCRIIDFDPLLNVAIASMKEKDIEMPFLHLHDIKGGELVEATVKSHSANGIVCSVVKGQVTGFLPFLHAVEGPWEEKKSKKPSGKAVSNRKSKLAELLRKFSVGKKITCRVLLVNHTERKVILSAKKKLIKSDLEPIIDCSQLSAGVKAIGFVADIGFHGLLIVFYNNIKGFLHRQELGVDSGDDIECLFYRGQVMEVVIKHYNSQTQRLALVLQTIGSVGRAKKTQNSDQYEVGKCYIATIHRRSHNGFQVKLFSTDKMEEDSAVIALLPFGHLTDCAAHVELFSQFFNPGDVLPRPVVLIDKTNGLTVSAKFSFHEAVQKDQFSTGRSFLIDSLDSFAVGNQYICTVKSIVSPHGIFVDLGHGLHGLASFRLLPAPLSALLERGYLQPNETVEAKIVEYSNDKQGRKRCLVSLRMKDVALSYTKNPINCIENILQSWILEYQYFCNKMMQRINLSSLPQVGSVIQIKLLHVSNQLGITAQMMDAVKVNCIASLPHVLPLVASLQKESGEFEITQDIERYLHSGQVVEALVLFQVITSNKSSVCLEVSLDPWLVKCCRDYKATSGTSVLENQMIDSRVLLVKPQFILVALLGHAVGKCAFLPSKRHWNDLSTVNQYVIDQKNRVTVKRIMEDGTILCNLCIHEPATSRKDRKRQLDANQYDANKIARTDYSDHVQVEISQVLDFQLNVTVPGSGNRPRLGRIHITQVYPSEYVQQVSTGQHILHDNFKVGQRLDAVFLKEREGTRDKHISPLNTSNYLDLTLKKENPAAHNDDQSVQYFLKTSPIADHYLFITNETGEKLFCPLLNLGSSKEKIMQMVKLLSKPGIAVVK